MPWHSRHSEPVAAHGMGAADLSAGDRAGKPDGPPIADEAQSPARDRFGSSHAPRTSHHDLVKEVHPLLGRSPRRGPLRQNPLCETLFRAKGP